MQKPILSLILAAAPVRRVHSMGFASECALTCVIEEVGGSGVSGTACVQEKEGGGIVFWNSDEFGNASPYNVNPGLKVGAIPFTIGPDDSTCGVTGHTVIVHKGCPSDRDDPCDPGVRIGCCVLA